MVPCRVNTLLSTRPAPYAVAMHPSADIIVHLPSGDVSVPPPDYLDPDAPVHC
jgi:hypothetical protein